ncbi:DUF805 domain-containing protein [Flavobacterium sp. 17A]|uniref:DUF805 domain-containing protein n=1 Tax=Flavobacterium potami TaxID=2872310 RepID=A0A9X1HAU3_9FLAO|nr:DUF805 domain-containing protein [Flavobacterium potami]
MKFRNILFFYSSFKEKSGRLEFALYLFVNILSYYFALHLWRTVNLDNEKILNMFYTCLIILLLFVPMQAVTTRRLRDLHANPCFVVFNFIPILNIIFNVFLLLAKPKNKIKL